MGNYLHLFIIFFLFLIGGSQSGDINSVDCLSPKSHLTKKILRQSNGIYADLDAYSDRVEVPEQDKMLNSMKEWLDEVNAYIVSGAVPHNTVKSVLSDADINVLKQKNPNMYWAKASVLSFAEIVRNPFSQHSVNDKFQFEGESVQTTVNQENYFLNQSSVRKDMIFLMQDIYTGKLTSAQVLRNRLVDMHKKLLLGENGNTPYYPITLLRSNKGDLDLAELRSIAGSDSDFYRLYDFENLFFVIQDFLQKEEIKRRDIGDISEIYSRFIRLETEYSFINSRYMFKFGNNSLFMNMINTMLALKGLSPVPHYHFDFNSIVLPRYFKQLFPGFLAADLTFSEIMDAFFQMALYRNMDNVFLKELFQAFAYRLKWLQHTVDFTYKDSSAVVRISA